MLGTLGDSNLILKDPVKRMRLFGAINIFSLLVLGIVLQIGGAYLVNAAVDIMGNAGGAAAAAAGRYNDYMEYITSLEPRQIAHVIFVSPLVEELVFRLIFLRAGRMLVPFWAANIIQSVLFGIYHGNAVQRVYGLVMGLIIGCVFYYCPLIFRARTHTEAGILNLPNSLMGFAATFILHMTINVSGLYLAPLLPADLSLPLQLAVGSFFMAVALLAVVWLYKLSRRL